jgi:hypothetical protein
VISIKNNYYYPLEEENNKMSERGMEEPMVRGENMMLAQISSLKTMIEKTRNKQQQHEKQGRTSESEEAKTKGKNRKKMS